MDGPDDAIQDLDPHPTSTHEPGVAEWTSDRYFGAIEDRFENSRIAPDFETFPGRDRLRTPSSDMSLHEGVSCCEVVPFCTEENLFLDEDYLLQTIGNVYHCYSNVHRPKTETEEVPNENEANSSSLACDDETTQNPITNTELDGDVILDWEPPVNISVSVRNSSSFASDNDQPTQNSSPITNKELDEEVISEWEIPVNNGAPIVDDANSLSEASSNESTPVKNGRVLIVDDANSLSKASSNESTPVNNGVPIVDDANSLSQASSNESIQNPTQIRNTEIDREVLSDCWQPPIINGITNTQVEDVQLAESASESLFLPKPEAEPASSMQETLHQTESTEIAKRNALFQPCPLHIILHPKNEEQPDNLSERRPYDATDDQLSQIPGLKSNEDAHKTEEEFFEADQDTPPNVDPKIRVNTGYICADCRAQIVINQAFGDIRKSINNK